ncbi:MAG: histidinol-phosphatase [Oscillospiraceae bacterium]|nr:histidinol-phosphatase [Oscillospiraceae bacterium]
MIRQNLHTHATFSDGGNTCGEIVLAAIEKGFDSVGFSEHAYTPYDLECCIKEDDIPRYFAEVQRLKEKFAGKIEVYLGFECDFFHNTEKTGLDYTIGSAHYVFDEAAGDYLNIDGSPQNYEKALNRAACGDIEELVKIYYRNVIEMARGYKPDIIGHLDIIAKFNRDNRYFDPESAWHRRIVREVAGKIAETGCIVEVNTGGIFRGATDVPFPSSLILRELYDLNVPVTVSSDSHTADSLDFWFLQAEELIKKTGWRSIKQLTPDGFIDVEL